MRKPGKCVDATIENLLRIFQLPYGKSLPGRLKKGPKKKKKGRFKKGTGNAVDLPNAPRTKRISGEEDGATPGARRNGSSRWAENLFLLATQVEREKLRQESRSKSSKILGGTRSSFYSNEQKSLKKGCPNSPVGRPEVILSHLSG